MSPRSGSTPTTTTTTRTMPTSLSPRPEIAVLPSLPPSPSFLDEVFSHPRPWSIRTEEFVLQGSRRSSSGSASSYAKGKAKQTTEDEDEEDDEDAQQRVGSREVYPPMTDETAETRRIEETLKRWELAERQRRKSARGSVQYTAGPSFLASFTRTAGLVLSGRTSLGTTVGPGSIRTFKSHDSVDVAREGYAVPLDDIDHAAVAVHSPVPSLYDRNASLDAGGAGRTSSADLDMDISEHQNPFVHPSEHTRTPTPLLTPVTSTPMLPPSAPPSPSPFSDTHAQLAVQGDGDLATRVSGESDTQSRKQASVGRSPSAPVPRPPVGAPHATQLQPTSQPVLLPRPRHEDAEERLEVRWWHEWLCGCGEGPDRGGDNQAGRTNPFE